MISTKIKQLSVSLPKAGQEHDIFNGVFDDQLEHYIELLDACSAREQGCKGCTWLRTCTEVWDRAVGRPGGSYAVNYRLLDEGLPRKVGIQHVRKYINISV